MTKDFNNGLDFYGTARSAVQRFVNRTFRTFFTKEDIEDMAATAFLKMWNARHTFDPEKGTLAAWGATVARNVVLSAARRKARERKVFFEVAKDEIGDDQTLAERIGLAQETDGQYLADEMEEGFFQVLTKERERRFLEWMLDGVEPTEMAQREGITLNHVYVLLHGLRKKLRNRAA